MLLLDLYIQYTLKKNIGEFFYLDFLKNNKGLSFKSFFLKNIH